MPEIKPTTSTTAEEKVKPKLASVPLNSHFESESLLSKIKSHCSIEKGRLAGLDLLRAIAIISVVIFHLPRDESQLFLRAISHYGYLGVDLFFVLSGYLIAGQAFKKTKINAFDPGQFYVRRFVRTLPSYYLILFISMVVYGFEKFSWDYLIFVQNFGGITVFTQSWSLCVEEHFYLLFPVLLVGLTKFSKVRMFPYLVIGVIVAGLVLRTTLYFLHRPDLLYAKDASVGLESYLTHFFYPTYTRLDGLAMGCLLAYWKNYHTEFWKKLINRPNQMLAIGIAIFLAIFLPIYRPTNAFNIIFGFPLVSLAFAFFTLGAFSERSLINRFKHPSITLISILSYSIYLTHYFALYGGYLINKNLGLERHSYFEYATTWVLIFIFAYALYYLFEKPVLKLRDRVL